MTSTLNPSTNAGGKIRGITRTIISAESGSTESDRAFLSICHECERYYTELDRGLQIRVEKWIEKLSLTGFNSVWKKHRNAYAKLLLHMILNKKFQEPFQKMPPEGQLPCFPVHLRTYTVRGAYGFDDRTHNRPFWRDIYQKVHRSPITLDLEEDQKKMTTFEDSIEDLRDSNNQILEIRRLDMMVREHQRELELVKDELEDEKKKRADLVKKALEKEKQKLEDERREVEEMRIQVESDEAERLRAFKKEEEKRQKEEQERVEAVRKEERDKLMEEAEASQQRDKNANIEISSKARKRRQEKKNYESCNNETSIDDEEESTSGSSEAEPCDDAITSLTAAIQEQQNKILRGEDVHAAVKAHKALSDALASLISGADNLKFSEAERIDKASSPLNRASALTQSDTKEDKENSKSCVCTVEVATSTVNDDQEGRIGPFSRGRVSRAWKFLFDLSVAPSIASAMNKHEADEAEPGDEVWPFYAAGYYEDPSLFTEEEKEAGCGGRVGVLEGDYPGMDQPRDTTDFMLRLNHKLFNTAEQTSAVRGIDMAPALVPSTAHPRLTSRTATLKASTSGSAPTACSQPARPLAPMSGARSGAELPVSTNDAKPVSRGTHVVPVPEPRDAKGNVYEYLQRHLELDHWEYKFDTPAGSYQSREE